MAYAEPDKEQLLVVNLSGRGDKDIFTVHKILAANSDKDQERYNDTSTLYSLSIALHSSESENQGAFVPFVTIGDQTLSNLLRL